MKTEQELNEELQSLKVRHKVVFEMNVPLNEDETEFAKLYLKKPDRIIRAAIGKLVNGPDPLMAVETLLKSCYIGGHDLALVLNNEDALLSTQNAVIDMLSVQSATLKKN
jgi:hypothetical protein